MNPGNLFRRARGILVTSLIWALSWIAIGILVRGPFLLERGFPPDASMLLATVQALPIVGAVGGLAFALLLMSDSRRTLRQLSLRRVAVLGAIGALVVPLAAYLGGLIVIGGAIPSESIRTIAELAVIGGTCAAGTLLIARRAPDDVNGEDPSLNAKHALSWLLRAASSHVSAPDPGIPVDVRKSTDPAAPPS